jgi:hypothetical protein
MAEPLNPLLTRRSLLGGGEEADPGTLPTITVPLANTAIFDAKMEPTDWIEGGRRQPLGQYLGHVTAVPGILAGRLTFRQHIRYGDKFMDMLTGAAYSGGAPISSMSSRKTWGFKLWQDGMVTALAGCAGTCVVELEDGKPALANWTWDGIWQTAANATLPAQAPLSTFPWVMKGATLTLGGAVPPRVNRIVIDLGNTVAAVEDVTKASGLGYFYVSERTPTVAMDTEARLVTDLDNYGLLTAGTEHALYCRLTSGANTLTIEAPKLQRVAIPTGDRGGKKLHDLTMQCNASNGDDELTFAAA